MKNYVYAVSIIFLLLLPLVRAEIASLDHALESLRTFQLSLAEGTDDATHEVLIQELIQEISEYAVSDTTLTDEDRELLFETITQYAQTPLVKKRLKNKWYDCLVAKKNLVARTLQVCNDAVLNNVTIKGTLNGSNVSLSDICGVPECSIADGYQLLINATSQDVPDTLVLRDGGSFAATTVTLTGVLELQAANGNSVSIGANDGTSDYTLILPTDNGTSGYVLTSGGTNPNQLTWQHASAVFTATIQLYGDVIGSTSATMVNTICGANACNFVSYVNSATSSNLPGTLVARDTSGNFSASTITANLTGTASYALASLTSTTALYATSALTSVSALYASSAATANFALTSSSALLSTTAQYALSSLSSTSAQFFTGQLYGDVVGTQTATHVSTLCGVAACNLVATYSTVLSATSSDTPFTLVLRDANGSFSATTLTLTGPLQLEAPNGNTITIAANSATTTYTFLLPTDNGTGGYVLTSAGTNPNQLSWQPINALCTATVQLFGDVIGSTTGTTVNTLCGQNACAFVTYVTSATSGNLPSTLVARDSSGNFFASTITANLTGTSSYALASLNTTTALYAISALTSVSASYASYAASANFALTSSTALLSVTAQYAPSALFSSTAQFFTGQLYGDVVGTQTATQVVTICTVPVCNIISTYSTVLSATSFDVPLTLVLRDSTGSFVATTLTLTGCLVVQDQNGAAAGQICGNTNALTLSPQGTRALYAYSNNALAADGVSANTIGGSRGLFAVDLQLTRTTLSQVASGTASALIGGYSNTVSGVASVVVGGFLNTVTGYSSSILAGVYNNLYADYSTIGGGQYNTINYGLYNSGIFSGDNNNVSGNISVIMGGEYNTILSDHSVIGAGAWNTTSSSYSGILSGSANQLPASGSAGNGSVILGGFNNYLYGPYAIIGAGQNNILGQPGLSSPYSGILSGFSNTVLGAPASMIGAGSTNTISCAAGLGGSNFIGAGVYNTIVATGASAYCQAIVAGQYNSISLPAYYSAIVSGSANTITGNSAGTQGLSSLIGCGQANTITAANNSSITSGIYNQIVQTGVGTGGPTNCAIVTGSANTIYQLGSSFAGVSGAFIGGGAVNIVTSPSATSTAFNGAIVAGQNNTVWATNSVIIAGQNNTVGGATVTPNAVASIIGAGQYNTITSAGQYSGILSGSANSIASSYAIIGSGQNNSIASNSNFSGILGGLNNSVGAPYSTIMGGASNSVTGQYAAAFGYSCTATGNYSLAIGDFAQAYHNNAFVWSDGSSTLFTSTASNTFNVLASNGVRFITKLSPSTGVQLFSGSGAWVTASDKTKKENYQPVDTVDILHKVLSMPIETWNYRSQDPSIRHMGPYAQDFYGAFKLGEDPLGICTIDADGVLYAAVQGLDRLHQETMNDFDRRIAELEERIKKLEKNGA